MKRIDLQVGTKYGRLVVLRSCEVRGRRRWECRCSCGGLVTATSWEIRSGAVVSCGCKKKDHLLSMTETHGDSKSPEFKAWENMITRCENEGTFYFKHYGGRGIRVCKRWRESYEAFLEDMGRRPGKGYSVDRFPNKDGDYEPGNCRWATQKQQMRNTRITRMLTVDGETKSLAEWSEISGLDRGVIVYRLKKGLDPKRAVFLEKHAQRKGLY